jgi:hypothetical protein
MHGLGSTTPQAAPAKWRLPVGVMYSEGSAYPPESPGPFFASNATSLDPVPTFDPRLHSTGGEHRKIIYGFGQGWLGPQCLDINVSDFEPTLGS